MCRKLIVVNELYLGARQLGWEAYSLPKGEIVEFTDKQLRNLLLTGKEEVYGLTISEETGELIPDTENFYCRNWIGDDMMPNEIKKKLEGMVNAE